jgi:hypothetical protein
MQVLTDTQTNYPHKIIKMFSIFLEIQLDGKSDVEVIHFSPRNGIHWNSSQKCHELIPIHSSEYN